GGDGGYLFYQTGVGAWPMGDSLTAEDFELFRRRIGQYMLKAVKEAKVNTSWLNPNPEYESAVVEFTRAALDPVGNSKFLADVEQFKKRLELPGQVNGLAQPLRTVGSPGCTATYEGCEFWVSS